MNCQRPGCLGKIKITNTISGGSLGSAQGGTCEVCKCRYTFVRVLVGEVKSRGDGVNAVAKKMREEGSVKNIVK